ncbi:hypothetical protein PRIPAC_80168 [Pristionchus pacificus]|uniref:Uncharacterized protein n=1 Tax=Pristionchus pacificus TaxID=54126 RepID=A0A2A6CJZ2_PRIPA|nr:hypothetical protein PRIPAC_80168 [Pristionchus pacificus]|eukprot:PDM78363.1 hypothetical protein PRIPAC_30942 [Pristionchus pacificus]
MHSLWHDVWRVHSMSKSLAIQQKHVVVSIVIVNSAFKRQTSSSQNGLPSVDSDNSQASEQAYLQEWANALQHFKFNETTVNDSTSILH